MTDTIGRVEFIVGLDGKRLSAEARKAGKQLAKAGDQGGEDYGKAFGDSAGHEIDPSLNKAMQRLQAKLSGDGKLAGKTYANSLKGEAVRVFRSMERDTVKALASKKGFEQFAKGFDTVDDAVKKLEKNVRRLSKEKIIDIDPDTGEELETMSDFFAKFEAGPAMQQVDKWTRKIKESEQATKEFREANEALRVNFDRLRASVDNVSFDKLAKNSGGAERAAEGLRVKMRDLAEEGGVTEREFHRFNITLEKQVERYNEVIRKQQEKIDKDRELAISQQKAKDAADRLNKALFDIEMRMGDSKTFADYVKRVGGAGNANRELGEDIDGLEVHLGRNNRTVGRLRRSLKNMVDGIENAGGAAAEAATGGFAKLFEKLKDLAGNKGGMSIGVIIALVAGLGAAVAALGSAASAALVGLISSLGVAIVGLGAAAGAAGVGLAWMVMKAVDAFGMMEEQSAEAKAGMDALADAAKGDSAEFARQWAPALADFTQKLAQLWRDDRMGEMAGKALGKITEAFTAVISSPAYTAFQTAMETTIPDALTNLGEGAAALVEGLLTVFATVGPILEEMMGNFETWAEDWRDSMATAAEDGTLTTFLQLASDSITAIMDALLSLGGLLGTIFTAGAPAGNAMLDMLTELFDDLNAFLQTPEGQDQLQSWFDNGVKLFEILLDLIGQLGGQFADMISPEIMDDTLTALSNLGDGLQIIFDLFQILGELDLFGNITAAFEVLSAFFTPLVDGFSTIATAIGDIVLVLLTALIPIFGALGEVLAPIVDAIALIVETILTALMPVIAALTPVILAIVEAFIPLGKLVGEVLVLAFEILWPIIQVVIDFIVDLIDAIAPLVEELMPALANIIDAVRFAFMIVSPVLTLIANILGGALKIALTVIIEVIKLVIGVVETVIGWFNDWVDFIKDEILPGFENFKEDIADIWEDIETVIGDVIDNIIGFFGGIQDIVNDAIGWFESLFGAADKAGDKASSAGSSRGGSGSSFGPTPGPSFAARGMLLNFPRRVIAGEAGPEAIVPLRRPLSQVDPSVRALSAVAQGLASAGGGGPAAVGAGRIVNIHPGAIVVQGSMAPEATATNVVNRLAERAVG